MSKFVKPNNTFSTKPNVILGLEEISEGQTAPNRWGKQGKEFELKPLIIASEALAQAESASSVEPSLPPLGEVPFPLAGPMGKGRGSGGSGEAGGSSRPELSGKGNRPADAGGSGLPGSGGNGGNGGETETVGNNLSFPVLFPVDVTPLPLRGSMDTLLLSDPYFVPGDYDSYYWFDQKQEGNEWQAYNEQVNGPLDIDHIDIGDALESARIETGRFVRIELALLKDFVATPENEDGWMAYRMENIDGQGKNEIQGTPYTQPSLSISEDLASIEALDGLTVYHSTMATVYAPESIMNLVIQKYEGDPVTGLLWDGETHRWVGAGIESTNYAADTGFGAELTVSGKVIAGVSGKPLSFKDSGNYCITFEIENNASIFLDSATDLYNVAGARIASIFADGEQGLGAEDTHNGLICLNVTVPSQLSGDEAALVASPLPAPLEATMI